MRMSKMLQVRNLPDSVHRVLKARAALAGMSLSDYVARELREVTERPTLQELQQRIKRRRHGALPVPAAQLIRAERDSR